MPATADYKTLSGVKDEFPALAREIGGHPIAYLDSGASAQKPERVLRAMDDFDRLHYSNVHRGSHTLSAEATDAYEGARRTVARHIGAETPSEVVFTANVTDAINLVAQTWGRANLEPGDRIALTEMEHHSNIVPWHLVAQETGAVLDWIGVDDQGRLDDADLADALARRPKLLALSHVSNVLGTINPVERIAAAAHDAGAMVLVDGAQAAPKLPIDMKAIGADFYVFTGHKAYGPTGIGVLWAPSETLKGLDPYRGGGSMIGKVTKERITWAPPPARFEAGTPPITQAVGLAAALEWMSSVGIDAIAAHEIELAAYAHKRLTEIPGLTLFGPPPGEDRVGILSFTIDGIHAHDIAEILDRTGVAVRAGHHCAQILMDRLGVAATARASLAAFNEPADIDRLVDGIGDAKRIFDA